MENDINDKEVNLENQQKCNNYKKLFLYILCFILIFALFIFFAFGGFGYLKFKFISLGQNYNTLTASSFSKIEKEIDVSKQGNKFEMNISVADSGFYRFGIAYANRDEFVEKYQKISDEIDRKYFVDEFWSNGKLRGKRIKKGYTYKEHWKEECEKLPLDRISDFMDFYKRDYIIECKPSQIILKIQIIPFDDKNTIKQYTDGKNRDMYVVLDYNGTYPFEMIYDTTQLHFNYHTGIRIFNGQAGHYKKMFAAGLYKGDYKVLVETLSDTPETAQILTLLFVERDNYGKMGEFENELK